MVRIFNKKWPVVVLSVIILTGIIFFSEKKFTGQHFVKNEIKIGWVTDIHADRFKKRDVDSGLLYPKQYKEYLPKVFDAMRAEGIDTVIATGDNTNSGDDNYARDILKIADEKGMDVIWVKGNHDSEEAMSALGRSVHDYYYFRDFENTRVIVLDNTEYKPDEYDYFGKISPEQMEWIKEALKTDKKIIIAMHIPIFDEDIISEKIHDFIGNNFTGVKNVLDRYAELEDILRENSNVKIVLSGHWHVPWQKEHNGIKYFGEAALTRKGYSGAYATINLGNYQVEYKFAK